MKPFIFIIGVPRSGTTLLRLMLDAHPDMAIPSETEWGEFLNIALKSDDVMNTFFDLFTNPNNDGFVNLGIDKDKLHERFKKIIPFDVSEMIRSIYRMYAENHGKKLYGDKYASNYSEMEIIQNTIPEAHFVHIIRDGRDVATSLLETAFISDATVKDIAEIWRDAIIQTQNYVLDNNPNYLEIRYEDLVTYPEKTIKLICDFIQLPYDPIMLSYWKFAEQRLWETSQVTLDNGSQIKDEDKYYMTRFLSDTPDPTRIGRFKNDMSDKDQNIFLQIAGDLLNKLDYVK